MHNGKYDSIENLTYETDGHYHLYVPVLYNFDTYANRKVDFVFDTGAFLTVISRETAAEFNFIDRFTIQKNISLAGFSGECLADLKEIPGIIIGGRKLMGVKVAVPHIVTDMDILGLNVIEHFKYFIDTENDKIYFSDNAIYKAPKELGCGRISAISDA